MCSLWPKKTLTPAKPFHLGKKGACFHPSVDLQYTESYQEGH